MAKIGKLTKLIKKWPSFTKLGRSNSSIVATNEANVSSPELHAVYVGKTRRQYLLSSDTICHPLFQELVERSGGYDDGQVVIACEVVLFEHLLWMLETSGGGSGGGGSSSQLDSMEELADFYYTR